MGNREVCLKVRRQCDHSEGGNQIPKQARERTLTKEEGTLRGTPVREAGTERSEGFQWARGRRSSQAIQALFRIPLLMPATGNGGVIVQVGAVSVDA